jgi:hypothetical protein
MPAPGHRGMSGAVVVVRSHALALGALERQRKGRLGVMMARELGARLVA